MTPRAAHTRVEQIVAQALLAADPWQYVQSAVRDSGLPQGVVAALRAIDEDGLRMAALLVARLRFERLLRGSPDAEALFDADPAEFTAVFRAYHQNVPPTAHFPGEEGRLFAAWRQKRPGS